MRSWQTDGLGGWFGRPEHRVGPECGGSGGGGGRWPGVGRQFAGGADGRGAAPGASRARAVRPARRLRAHLPQPGLLAEVLAVPR